MNVVDKLRILHGQLYEQITPQKGFWKSLRKNKEPKIDYPIDIVVTWVDGNDSAWRKEKEKYQTENQKEGNREERYRNWNIFQYWFRAIEQYAPWVNHIFLLTYGHIPEWLNIDSPKLTVVKHEEFIPERYLPTFSSIPIELNMWRIQELSEHFIYFNDDMFLTAPVIPEDFFGGEFPKYAAIAVPIANYTNVDAHAHQLFGNIGLINANFNIRSCMVKYPEKWFAKCYGSDREYNKRVFHDKYLAGMEFTHLACPYRKSTCNKVWDKLFEQMDQSSSHRFRTAEDVMHQIFQLWEICEGSFCPVKRDYYGKRIINSLMHLEKTSEAISNQTNKMICLNDNEHISQAEFEKIQPKLVELLDQTFTEKSQFEL